MYQYASIKTELNLLAEEFKENKKLYFLTHFSGVLLYVLVLGLNFYRIRFMRVLLIRQTTVYLRSCFGVIFI